MNSEFQSVQHDFRQRDVLVVPKLLPDEFILGWLGRFSIANGRDDTWCFLNELKTERKLVAPADQTTYLTSELVTDYVEISPLDLKKLHTFAPWFRCCDNTEQSQESILDGSRSETIRKAAHRSSYCLDCIRQDGELWGWTYWRRSQQLPGVTHCLKHGTRLHFTSSLCFITHSPLRAISIGKPVVDGSSFAQHYSEIAVGMMEEARPRNLRSVRESLNNLIAVLSGESTFVRSEQFLASAAMKKVPDTWVSHAFLGKVTKNQVVRTISTSTTNRLTPAYVAIALSVLFDDSEQALLYWKTDRIEPRNRAFPKAQQALVTNTDVQR